MRVNMLFGNQYLNCKHHWCLGRVSALNKAICTVH